MFSNSLWAFVLYSARLLTLCLFSPPESDPGRASVSCAWPRRQQLNHHEELLISHPQNQGYNTFGLSTCGQWIPKQLQGSHSLLADCLWYRVCRIRGLKPSWQKDYIKDSLEHMFPWGTATVGFQQTATVIFSGSQWDRRTWELPNTPLQFLYTAFWWSRHPVRCFRITPKS